MDPTLAVEPDRLARIRAAAAAYDFAAAAREIPDDLLARVALAGTPDEVAEQAHALYAAGAARVEFGTPHGLDAREGCASWATLCCRPFAPDGMSPVARRRDVFASTTSSGGRADRGAVYLPHARRRSRAPARRQALDAGRRGLLPLRAPGRHSAPAGQAAARPPRGLDGDRRARDLPRPRVPAHHAHRPGGPPRAAPRRRERGAPDRTRRQRTPSTLVRCRPRAAARARPAPQTSSTL